MKYFYTYVILTFFFLPASGQYYLRGEVKDEKNKPLPYAKIFLHSQRANYSSGSSGSFGIILRNLYDTITVSLDGFETATFSVKADVWQNLVLKSLTADADKNKNKLVSITRNQQQTEKKQWLTGDETYFRQVENDFVNAQEYPNTGFSLNINKASYSNVRRFLNMGSLVPPDAVRTEELVNYFNLHYREPANKEDFNIETQLSSCPWNEQEQLLFVNVSAKKLNFDKVPPGNFIFLIDVSGSMDLPNRLPLIKAAFQLFVKNLRSSDTVSIVTYGGYVKIWLQPTSGENKTKIIEAIEQLQAEGDTPGESAIRVAYQLAKKTYIKGGNNRIILATDGDFNIGETSEKALDELISKHRESGVYLTCLGVGMGNFKDSKLQTLAKKGNGNYAYLDDINEAERVLVKELSQTFYAVANDVYIDMQFNPDYVKKYRLVGFDNNKDALEDKANDLEGGEFGSGSTMMAIFEIVPAESGQHKSRPVIQPNVARLQLKYLPVNETYQKTITRDVVNNYAEMESIDRDYRFAAAVTMFGLKLKQSVFVDKKDWDYISAFSKKSADSGVFLQNEFLGLVDKAQKLYGSKKKKRVIRLF